MRVRSLACANETLFSAPCSLGILFLLRPLAICGKSSAIRAGLLSVKLAGGLASASFKCTRMLTRPPASAEKSILSILLVKAFSSAAFALPNKLVLTKSTNASNFVVILIMSIPIHYSCRLILAVRSTQSPVRSSWIISLRAILVSSILVTKPKFGPI